MKKLFIYMFGFTLMFLPACVTTSAQTAVRRCPTCGRLVQNCKYRGMHPKPQPASPQTIAAKPSPAKMQKDMVGHTIADPSSNSYHPSDWKLMIRNNSISGFTVIERKDNGSNRFMVRASMKIAEGNHAYTSKVQLHYKLVYNEWKIDYIVAERLDVVVTHEYDNLIKSYIDQDGWGGTYCVFFENRSEITLIVGGDMLAGGERRRFSVVVDPHATSSVGGLFGGGSVTEYKINFVIRK